MRKFLRNIVRLLNALKNKIMSNIMDFNGYDISQTILTINEAYEKGFHLKVSKKNSSNSFKTVKSLVFNKKPYLVVENISGIDENISLNDIASIQIQK